MSKINLDNLRKELMQIRPFNKNEPYLFISYSHTDRERVWKDIIELKRRNINCWIDCECIDGWINDNTKDWSDQALRAMEKSKAVLIYISEKGFNSKGFSKECKYLYNKLKDKIFFKFLINFNQSINTNEMIDIIENLEQNDDTKKEFINRKHAFYYITNCDNSNNEEDNYYLHYDDNQNHLNNYDFDNSIRLIFNDYKEDTIFISKKGINSISNFVGRTDELEEIHNKLYDNNYVVLYGDGGIGKTTLVNEYLKKYKNEYENYYFSVSENIKNYIINLPFKKTINVELTDRNRYDLNLNIVQNLSKNNIFVIDSYDRRIEDDPNIRDLIDNIKCKIIITTRVEPQNLNKYEIKGIKYNDLINLVIGINPSLATDINDDNCTTKKELELLFNRLSNNTKAITLAINIMNKYCWSIKELNKNLFKDSYKINENKNSFKQILLELFNLTNLKKQEIDLLKLLTLFKYPGVNKNLIKNVYGVKYLDNIDHLIDLNIINKSDDSMIYLHSLISELIVENYLSKIKNFNKLIKYIRLNNLELYVNLFILEKYVNSKKIKTRNVYKILYKSYYFNSDYYKTIKYTKKLINPIRVLKYSCPFLIALIYMIITILIDKFVNIEPSKHSTYTIMISSLFFLILLNNNDIVMTIEKYFMYDAYNYYLNANSNINKVPKILPISYDLLAKWYITLSKINYYDSLDELAIDNIEKIINKIKSKKNIDSKILLELYYLAGSYYMYYNSNLSEIYFEKSFNICKQLYRDYEFRNLKLEHKLLDYQYNILTAIDTNLIDKNEIIKLKISYEYGKLFYNNNSYETSLSYLSYALELINNLYVNRKIDVEFVDIYKYMRNIYTTIDYKKSVEYGIKYIESLEQNKKFISAYNYFCIGVYLSNIGKYEESISYFVKTLDKINNTINLLKIKSLIGLTNSYYKLRDDDNAIDSLYNCIECFNSYYESCFLHDTIDEIEDKTIDNLCILYDILSKDYITKYGEPNKLYSILYHISGYFLEKEVKYDEAFEKYISSYGKGFNLALISIGLMYLKDTSSEYRNIIYNTFNIACENNNELGYLYLGLCYLNGINVEKNIDEGKRLVFKSIENNNMIALYNLGDLYYKGQYLKKSVKKALKYLALSEKQGYTPAKLKKALILKEKKGFFNQKKAFDIFNSLAKESNPVAMYELGNYYRKGIKFYLKKDIEIAKKLIESAENLGIRK